MKIKSTTAMALALFVAGCGTSMDKASEKVSETVAFAESALSNVGGEPDTLAGASIVIHDDFYIPTRGEENEHGDFFPQEYSDFIASSEGPLTLTEARTLIAQLSGITINIDDGEQFKDRGGRNETSVFDSAGRPLATTQQRITPAGAYRMDEAEQYNDNLVRIKPFRFQGHIQDLLSMVAGHFGYDWIYKDNKVLFFKYISRTYQVALIPGVHTLGTSLSSSSVGGGGSRRGGGQFQANITNENSYSASVEHWSDVEQSIKAMIGDNGKVSVAKSSGTVTVTADRQTQRRIKNYIDNLNEDLTTQIMFEVNVYTVTLTDRDAAGFSVTGLFNPKSGKFSIGGQANLPSLTDGTLGSSGSFAIFNPNSAFNGSSVLFEELSRRGKVSVVESTSVVTSNYIPAPVQVVKTQAYLAEFEKTVSGDGLTGTSLRPDQVTTGFKLNLLPKAMRDGQIMLQYTLTLSDLLGIEVFTAGEDDSRIQLPQVSSSSFSQRAIINSGEVLVLAGFESLASSFNKNSSGPIVPIFGMNADGSNERRIVVISIRPQLQSTRARVASRG